MKDGKIVGQGELVCEKDLPYDLLADYYYAITSREATTEISAHLKQCKHCQTMLVGIRNASQEVEGREELESRLDAGAIRLQNFLNHAPEKHETPVRSMHPAKRNKRVVKWLAAAMFIGLLGFWLRDAFDAPISTKSQLAIHLSEPYPGPQIVRSSDTHNNREQELFAAFEAYNEGHFTEASSALQSLIKQGETDLRVYFYYGLSSLYRESPNLQDAQHYLERVANSKSNYRQQASWLLSLAYAKDGKQSKANELWKLISEDDAHYKKQDARQLLKSAN